ncbi:MAG: 4Fe-4S dicluster domain-containing protein [Spirochaetaceae bacterium]|nr:4Fe-4S dicluster domain-containing protein [Spirochaetaceae bacterium]
METKKILLTFNKNVVEKPIVYHLVKDFDLITNIYRASISAEEQGLMVLDISGSSEMIEAGINFIRSQKVKVEDAQKSFRWDAELCTSCGNCLTHCPVNALHINDRKTMKVEFDEKLCIDCMGCIPNCPYEACGSIFEKNW